MDDNFTCIYKILRALERSLDYEEFDEEQISPQVLGITKNRWEKYMEMMSDAGYIKGIIITEYVTGEKIVKVENIAITIKGLEYLTENSIMQRIYKAAKGIKEITPGL